MASVANPLEGIQQDKDGNYFDVVDLGDGSGAQVFKGKTVAEVLAQYRKAQTNATKKIRELALAVKMQAVPDPATPTRAYAPYQPSADEMWKLAEDLKNPATARAAMRRAMEWELGTSLDEVRNSLITAEAERRRAEIHRAAADFMDAHPEFKPCNENENAIYGWLDARKLSYSRKNLEIAFEELKPGLVLISKPNATNVETPTEAVIPQTVTRPRTASTGLSPRSSSAVPPRENPATKGRLTEAEIDAMPTDEYLRRYNGDPVWRAEAEKVLQAAAEARRK